MGRSPPSNASSRPGADGETVGQAPQQRQAPAQLAKRFRQVDDLTLSRGDILERFGAYMDHFDLKPE